MKRFYIKGTAFTSKGIVLFQERSLKKAIKKIKTLSQKYMIVHQKFIRKGKVDYWYKNPLWKIDGNRIKVGGYKNEF